MAEDDNIVLRPLREIRDERQEQSRRLIKVERQMGELRESMSLALGLGTIANKTLETAGERFDEIEDRLVALGRRVAELEAKE